MRIQHNIPAMAAYRNYTNNTSAVAKNLEKLSSGYKINRAGDDAAGLAVSEKMRAQITGLEVAQKNAKDGISLVQTAEGALTEVHDMLNRMYELAELASNGTYDDEVDRANYQKEIDSLTTEINRIADSVNFNGINLLDGSMESGETIQVNGGTNLSIGAAGVTQGTNTIVHKDGVNGGKTTFEINLSNIKISASGATTSGTVTLTISGVAISAAVGIDAEASDVAKALQKGVAASGVTIGGVKYDVTVDGDKLKFEMSDDSYNAITAAASFAANFTVTAASTGLKINGLADAPWGTSNVKEGALDEGTQLADATATAAFTINNFKDGAGIKIGNTTYVYALTKETANTNFGTGYKVIDLTDLANADGDALDTDATTGNTRAVEIAIDRITQAAADNDMFVVGQDGDKKLTFREQKNYSGDADLTTLKGIQAQLQTYTSIKKVSNGQGKSLTLQIGDTADDFNKLKVSINDMHAKAMGIGSISVSTQDGASAAMAKIKDAINYVSSTRGDLGATQNRLEHTINNLSVMQENIQDAESTIRDVDIAKEMMAYTKNNILVQSAQAMLAQANQLPQGVLQLLQ